MLEASHIMGLSTGHVPGCGWIQMLLASASPSRWDPVLLLVGKRGNTIIYRGCSPNNGAWTSEYVSAIRGLGSIEKEREREESGHAPPPCTWSNIPTSGPLAHGPSEYMAKIERTDIRSQNTATFRRDTRRPPASRYVSHILTWGGGAGARPAQLSQICLVL